VERQWQDRPIEQDVVVTGDHWLQLGLGARGGLMPQQGRVVAGPCR
jgi:hypothetical protein